MQSTTLPMSTVPIVHNSQISKTINSIHRNSSHRALSPLKAQSPPASQARAAALGVSPYSRHRRSPYTEPVLDSAAPSPPLIPTTHSPSLAAVETSCCSQVSSAA
ncbi:hypothetical protein M0R45_026257 [Rubus argutus]|uniref:Uncharacterized protein n=1 Tax=Rubus argutus TaxID=59490 RepID=A0AAW1WYD4_RUBAR